MAKAIAVYTGGIHNRTEVAIRTDGAVFQRWQSKGRYGYQWSAWKDLGERMGENMRANPPHERQSGFSKLRLAKPNDAFVNNRACFNAKGEIRYRLPN